LFISGSAGVLNAQCLTLGQPNPRAGCGILSRRKLGIGVLARAESSRKRERDKYKDENAVLYNADTHAASNEDIFSHGLGSLSATLSMKQK
jgi:hypothetical protein